MDLGRLRLREVAVDSNEEAFEQTLAEFADVVQTENGKRLWKVLTQILQEMADSTTESLQHYPYPDLSELAADQEKVQVLEAIMTFDRSLPERLREQLNKKRAH